MSIHIIPSVLAFIFTCAALVYTSKKSINSKTFYIMVLIFTFHHCCEVILFLEHLQEAQTTLIIKTYHALSICALTAILIYAHEVSQLTRKYYTNALIAISLVIALTILISDSVIFSSETLNYTSTAIKGNLYVLFQVNAIALLALTVFILINGYLNSKSHMVQIRCSYVLLAFSPLIASCLLVIGLMAIGVPMNATIIMPISTTIFLFIIIKSESKHKLTDLRRYLPFSPERQTSKEILELYSLYSQDEISYKECMNQIERHLVIHKYTKSGKNASATAKSMEMPRSSLYSIFNRLKIDIKDQ